MIINRYILARGFVMVPLISMKYITNSVHLSLSGCAWFHCDLSNIHTSDQRLITNDSLNIGHVLVSGVY